MKLPQDKILHIYTEIKNGKENIVLEWQGELVRCKDCKYLGIKDLVYGHCKHRMTGIIMPDDYCSHGERKEP